MLYRCIYVFNNICEMSYEKAQRLVSQHIYTTALSHNVKRHAPDFPS